MNKKKKARFTGLLDLYLPQQEARRRRKHLAFSLSCCKRRRRPVFTCLSGACGNLWLYPSGYGRSHWKKNKRKCASRIWKHESKMEVSRISDFPGSCIHHDLLLRNRRMDFKISGYLFQRKRTGCRCWRIFYFFYYVKSFPHRIHADFSFFNSVDCIPGSWKGNWTFFQNCYAWSASDGHRNRNIFTYAFPQRRWRSGSHCLDGLAVYLIPNFEGLTPGRFLEILLDAMSQLFSPSAYLWALWLHMAPM